MELSRVLSDHLAKFHTAPFLFVGSGISRRYVGLETWEQLLRRFCESLERPFEYYSSKGDGYLPQVASLMCDDFHEVWWRSEAYALSRGDGAGSIVSKASCLKIEIARYLQQLNMPDVSSNRVAEAELTILRDAQIDGVITTNWDCLLEAVFPDFKVFVGQQAILAANPQGIAEIFKIHGCSTDPNSLVLTNEDYSDFDSKNPYLAAKLLTIFVEHPVLFLGYSLGDRNIQLLLSQLASCLSGEYLERLRDKLIFVEWDAHRTGDSFHNTLISANGRHIPVTVVRTDNYGDVYAALAGIERRLPARVLRNLKEHLYELIVSNDPKEKIAVVDIEAASDFSDVEVVYGVGIKARVASLGYSRIEADDLLLDSLSDALKYDAERIVQEVLPELTKGNQKNVPIFKYLRAAGYIGRDGLVVRGGLNEKLSEMASATQEFFYPPQQYMKKQNEIRSTYRTLGELISQMTPENAVMYIPLLREEEIDTEQLKQFILANWSLMDSKLTLVRTYIRRLICLYDWLLYSQITIPKHTPAGGPASE